MSNNVPDDATKEPEKVRLCSSRMDIIGHVDIGGKKGNNGDAKLPFLTNYSHCHHTLTCMFPSDLFLQEGGASVPEQNKRSPSDFLKAVLGRPVNVRLSSGTDYRGNSFIQY